MLSETTSSYYDVSCVGLFMRYVFFLEQTSNMCVCAKDQRAVLRSSVRGTILFHTSVACTMTDVRSLFNYSHNEF